MSFVNQRLCFEIPLCANYFSGTSTAHQTQNKWKKYFVAINFLVYHNTIENELALANYETIILRLPASEPEEWGN